MKRIYDFLRSIKLAIVLIIYIVGTSILSTFFQGGEKIFSSMLFLLPVFLFFVNLSVCTFHRIRKRIAAGAKKRFGPDILHMGLLIMIIGGTITAVGRQEGGAWMAEGDSISVPGGYTMVLDSFQFLTWDNGSPRDWISTVTVEKDGKTVSDHYPIEVNKPLKLGNVKIYQAAHKNGPVLHLGSADGKDYTIEAGQMIPDGDIGWLLKEFNGDRPVFERWKGDEPGDSSVAEPGDEIGGYRIGKTETVMSTGLQMVIDPGYYTVLAGLLLLAAGLFLTYIQKLGDSKI